MTIEALREQLRLRGLKENKIKVCIKCLIEYSTKCFYKNGKDATCKHCRCKKNKQIRRDSPEVMRAYDKQAYRKEGRKKSKVAYDKKHTQQTYIKEAKREASTKHRANNQDKAYARAKVSQAIREGKLMALPCTCGTVKTEAHHEDYSKPLDVIWLCKRCHSALHNKTS